SVPDTTPNSRAICAIDLDESIANSSDCSAGVRSVWKSGVTGEVSGSSSRRSCSTLAVISAKVHDRATASHSENSAEAEMSDSQADFDSCATASTDAVIAQ